MFLQVYMFFSPHIHRICPTRLAILHSSLTFTLTFPSAVDLQFPSAVDRWFSPMFSQVTFASHEAALALTLSEKASSYFMLACVVVF